MNSLTFNGIRKPFVKVLERGRPYWAPRYNEFVTRGNNHRIRNTKTEPVPIPVTLLIDGSSKEDLLNKAEEIAEWLITDKEAPLVFDDRTNRTHWVVLEGAVDEEEIVSFSRASLEFISLYKTGASKTLNLTSTMQSFTITGQTETPWVSTTTFTVPQSSFLLESSTGKITLNYNFIAGDVLEIDYKSRDILVNGINLDIGLSLESVWFDLKPRMMQFKASHPTAIKYDERYY